MTDTEDLNEIKRLLDRADEMERQVRLNPFRKTISYMELLARRQGLTLAEFNTKMGFDN